MNDPYMMFLSREIRRFGESAERIDPSRSAQDSTARELGYAIKVTAL